MNNGALSGASGVTVGKALVLTIVMGAVIFFCRAFPFLIFRDKTKDVKEKSSFAVFLTFVEKVAPPVAMTALAFNALASPVKDAVLEHRAGNIASILCACLPLVAGTAFTAVSYVWKRNTLISIFGGTILYMALGKMIG
ncbi:MAG: AzlD domain-containing protein [Treponema sp.]|jgi:branched-subunit amino acid transport protein AzlD|nr:AzlD domain-containing protein [Treponema sp.]